MLYILCWCIVLCVSCETGCVDGYIGEYRFTNAYEEQRDTQNPPTENRSYKQSLGLLEQPVSIERTQPIVSLPDHGHTTMRHTNHRRRSHDYLSKRSYVKPILNEVDLWSPAENKVQTTGVFRTHGKGEVRVPWKGATVHVPNQKGHSKAHRGTITTRVYIPKQKSENVDLQDRETVPRYRRDCSGCPDDRTVMATRGYTYVLLPEPCPPLKWTVLSGPRPGTKLREGQHTLQGRLGFRNNICQYHYRVIVRHCRPLYRNDLQIDCTADDAWGSKCSVSCTNNKTIVGNSALECLDNLEWSHSLPTCKARSGCDMPYVPEGAQTTCQTGVNVDYEDTVIPEQAECRFLVNGKESVVKCQGGEWIRVHNGEDRDYQHKALHDNTTNVCEPNPCQHGGTCLRAPRGNPYPICMCAPDTQGSRCEMQHCTTNICEHGGQCLVHHGKKYCYCLHNFTGKRCHHVLNNLIG